MTDLANDTSLKYQTVELGEGVVKFRIEKDGTPLRFMEVFDSWVDSSHFIQSYTNFLISLDFPAFFWEHPALNKNTLSRDYECVILRSTFLENVSVDEHSFSDFIHRDSETAEFMNLGRDALLVIPTKTSPRVDYAHMAAFLRSASSQQTKSLFHAIGQSIKSALNQHRRIWLNTSGLGVFWLHIRLDYFPKYYQFLPYKDPAFVP